MRLLDLSHRGSPTLARTTLTGHATCDGAFGPAEFEGHGFITTRFSPGARTAWHTHPLGQTVIVTQGQGLLQIDGLPVQSLQQGDLVKIPPNIRHWQGADDQASMVQISITDALDGAAVAWFEPSWTGLTLTSGPTISPTDVPTILPLPKAA